MKKVAENQDDKKYVYMDTEKTCPNHRKIHDDVTEALIPRPTEAAIHGAKDRTSEADQ